MGGATIRLWGPVVLLFHASVAGAFFANHLLTEEGNAWHTRLGEQLQLRAPGFPCRCRSGEAWRSPRLPK